MTQNLLNLGKIYMDERCYDEAYFCFLEAALENDFAAIKNLGVLYLYGEGVAEDFEKAFHYFRLSYDLSKDLSSIPHLMVFREDILSFSDTKKLYRDFLDYLIDDGQWEILVIKANEYSKDGAYPVDINKKINFFEEAVVHGVDMGAECLGEMYFLGEEVKRDYKKAYEYFNAHDGSESFSKPYYLGMMYENGFYVHQDQDKALEYYLQITESQWPWKSCDDFYGKAMKKVREMTER